MTARTSATTMFKSARASGNTGLVAFAAALLTAFALHAGAFLPQLSAPGQARGVELASPAPAQSAPVAVAGADAPARPCG